MEKKPDYVDNVDAVVTAIREIFDETVADIITTQSITTQSMYERINEPLVNASNTTQIGLVIAFVVAALVILFSMVLMVRQQVKEIGILKAIGASNWHIEFQFSLEALAMSMVGAVIGALITFPLAQKVADLLVSSPTGPGGGFVVRGGFFGGSVTSIAGIDVAVSPEVFLYTLGIAIALTVAASIFPAWYISRVKPAEVLCYE